MVAAVALDQIREPARVRRRLRRGHPRPTADGAREPHRPHKAADRAARDVLPFAPQLAPDLPRAVHLMIRVPDPLNLDAPDVVALGPGTPSRGIHVSSLVQEVCRRGDRHHGADRLDPIDISMGLDEPDHHFARRSSSAWAKYADALRKISFARFSSRFSRSNAFSRCRSSVVSPLR